VPRRRVYAVVLQERFNLKSKSVVICEGRCGNCAARRLEPVGRAIGDGCKAWSQGCAVVGGDGKRDGVRPVQPGKRVKDGVGVSVRVFPMCRKVGDGVGTKCAKAGGVGAGL